MRRLNVFSGPRAVRDFLDPQNQLTPLVELPSSLNPFPPKAKIRIFMKAANLGPLLNLKLIPAWEMLKEAYRTGQLEGVRTLIENSSGNMAFSLSILAPYFEVKRVKAIVPADIAGTKEDLLRLAGTEFVHSTDVPGEPSGIAKARKMGRKKGMRNLAQYENSANPNAHEKWTAGQVWKQTDGKITVFAAGLGTTGTAVGAYNFFHKNGMQVAVVGVLCAPDNAVPGVRSESRLAEIRFNWRGDTICRVEARAKESYKMSLKLIRSGLLAGPSSGFALVGLIRFLTELSQPDALRNDDGEVVAVFVAGDIPHPYLDKYMTVLDPQDFGQ